MKRLLQLRKYLIDLYKFLLLDEMKKLQAPKTKYRKNSNNRNSSFKTNGLSTDLHSGLISSRPGYIIQCNRANYIDS